MKKVLLALLALLCFLSVAGAQKAVLGVEANGSDSATISAYEWRKVNVYDGIYAKAGFKVVLLSQATKAKVVSGLDGNAITHITGCGHGNVNVYTGYNQGYVFTCSDTALLAKLSGKHIHLLSCLTAQQLGPDMIKYGAKSYAGYYPSFYFTWKSTARFFDADAELDRAFAEGQTAPQGYKRSIDKFNAIMEILKTEDPDAVQYIVIDRDGLRCFPSRTTESVETVLPLEMANQIVYVKNPQTNEFISFAESNNLGISRSRDISREDLKALVIAAYEKMDPEFELGILSRGRFTRDQLIAEIKHDTEVGKDLVEIRKYFLDVVAESRWSQTMEVTTDAEGSVIYSGNFDVPMTITTKEVKGTWGGEPNTFQNVLFTLNNDILFNGSITNGQGYSIVKKINKGQITAAVKAVGGPKNTKVKVTLTFNIG